MGDLRFEQININIRIIRSMKQKKIVKYDYEDYNKGNDIVLVIIVILPF